MRNAAGYLKQAAGIGQDLEWLLRLGVSLTVSLTAAGVATLAALPWWSVIGAGLGIFMVVLWAVATTRHTMDRRRPFTPIIERGYVLRERLAADQHDGSDQRYVAAWQTRVDDWVAEALAAIRVSAPNREGAFTVDLIVADSQSLRDGPFWKGSLLLDLDIRIERLILVRASL